MSYRRYYSLHSSLLSSLVSTTTAFGISIFQVPETQYSSVEKVKVCKIFQGTHPSDLQLNASLASLIPLRLRRLQKNKEPF